MGFDAGAITGSIDLDTGPGDRKLAGFVASTGAASGQIEASFGEVRAVLSEAVAPALAQVAAAATAAAASVAPAVDKAATAAAASVAAMAPAVERVAAAASAAIASVVPAAQQVGASAAASVAAITPAMAGVGSAAAAATEPIARMASAGRLLAEAAAYSGVSLSSMPGAIVEVTAAHAGLWTTATSAAGAVGSVASGLREASAAAGTATSTVGSLTSALAGAGAAAQASIAPVAPAAARAAAAIGQAASAASAGAERASGSVGRITEAFPRVDAAADRAGRAVERAIGPAAQRAASAATSSLDGAAIAIERVVSGTVSPAIDRMAARAGAALASVAPAVNGVAAAAGTASASLGKVGDLAGQVSAHVSTLFGQARSAAAPLAGVLGSVGESLTGLRISAVGAADHAAAAFAAAAEPLSRSLAPAIERVAEVAGPAFDRLRAGAVASGTAAAAASVQVGSLALAAGTGLASAASAVGSLSNAIGGNLAPAINWVASEAASAVAELSKFAVVGTIGAATAAVGGLYEAVERAGGKFHEMGLAAERAGVSVEWLSRLAAVAGTAGVELEGVSNGMRMLEQRASQASAGDEAGIKAFSRLGISAQQAAVLMADPQKMLERVRAGIAQLGTAADRVGAAKGLLGLGGNQLIPLLTMDTAEFDRVADRMQRLGGTVSEQDAAMGRSLGELEGYFHAAMLGIERAVAVPVLAYLQRHMDQVEPQIETATTAMTTAVAGAWEWLAAEADKLLPHLAEVGGAAGDAVPLFDRLRAAVGPIADATKSLVAELVELAGTISEDLANAFAALDPKLDGVSGSIAKIVQGAADAIAAVDRLWGSRPDAQGQKQAYDQVGATAATSGRPPQDVGPAPMAGDRTPERVDADLRDAQAKLLRAQQKLKAAAPGASKAVQEGFAESMGETDTTRIADAVSRASGAGTALQRARSDLASAEQVAAALRQLQALRGTTSVDPAAVDKAQARYNDAVRRSQQLWGGLDKRPLNEELPPRAVPLSDGERATAKAAAAAAGSVSEPVAPQALRQTYGPPSPTTPQPLVSPPAAAPAVTSVAVNKAAVAAANAKPAKQLKRGGDRPRSQPPVAAVPSVPDLSAAHEQVRRMGAVAVASTRDVGDFGAAVRTATQGMRTLVDDVVSRFEARRSGAAGYEPRRDDAGGRTAVAAGPTTVNVQARMSFGFDVRETADTLAAKLLPGLQAAHREASQRLEGAVMARMLARSSGGES